MKFSIALIIQVASLATAQSRADVTETEAAEICGALGVMEVPAGVDPGTVRMCREHPTVLEEVEKTLDKRRCWSTPKAGCSNSGWCYKICNGKGGWCWTTWDGPSTSWRECFRDEHCTENHECGGRCSC
ncbi:hypothetical protein ISF_07009 [Cordyceps fumosorosea ARSEF 2679]|uniref:IDI-2 n=1 Tax=Cordyceps fumosorosea (strain ARSEF 2679) TaxID=1081104 RepID=A0A167QM95_CORFA|nr:hypothetical protein ISF_07009 [Cordyceps fumosorosea ARSEF 2679]OAA57768.1 hypothetical protein ISF_07009 [Cordyceps fumosorosea ARSEF 2679]